MPLIQADIRRGRTTQQRDQLVSELTRIVHEVSGAPIETISAVVRELPGAATYEAGMPSPEYQPGPDGTDLAAAAELASRPPAGPGRRKAPEIMPLIQIDLQPLSDQQRSELRSRVVMAVSSAIGSPPQYVSVIIRESAPASLVEAGGWGPYDCREDITPSRHKPEAHS